MNCLFTGWHCHCVLNHLPTDFHPPWARQNGISGPNRVFHFFFFLLRQDWPFFLCDTDSYPWKPQFSMKEDLSVYLWNKLCIQRPFPGLGCPFICSFVQKSNPATSDGLRKPEPGKCLTQLDSGWISVQLPANTPGNINTFFHLLSCLQFALGGLGLGKHQYFDVMTW